MDLVYISKFNKTLALTGNDLFHIINVDGMTSAASDISSVVVGSVDGDIINNVRVQPRGIVIDLRIKSGINVEDAKRSVLSVIKVKQSCTLVWTQNNRAVRISGVVESIDMPRFNNSVTMQVSIHCAQPFWEDVDDVIRGIREVIDLHYFTGESNGMLFFPDDGIAFGEIDQSLTREIYNAGDVDVGATFIITALDTVTNPRLTNADGLYFGLGTSDAPVILGVGDQMILTTYRGNKNVKINGVSAFAKVTPGSTWIQLAAGPNVVTLTSAEGEADRLTLDVTYKQRYI